MFQSALFDPIAEKLNVLFVGSNREFLLTVTKSKNKEILNFGLIC